MNLTFGIYTNFDADSDFSHNVHLIIITWFICIFIPLRKHRLCVTFCLCLHACGIHIIWFVSVVDFFPLGGDKVSMLAHTCPHKPLRNTEVTISLVWRQKGLSIYLKQVPVRPFCLQADDMQLPDWQPTLYVAWWLTWWFAWLCMVIHDTECPYWDQVSLNKRQNKTSSVVDMYCSYLEWNEEKKTLLIVDCECWMCRKSH